MKKLKEVKIFNYNFYDFFYSKYLFQKNLEILEIEDDFVILTRQTRLKFFKSIERAIKPLKQLKKFTL